MPIVGSEVPVVQFLRMLQDFLESSLVKGKESKVIAEKTGSLLQRVAEQTEKYKETVTKTVREVEELAIAVKMYKESGNEYLRKQADDALKQKQAELQEMGVSGYGGGGALPFPKLVGILQDWTYSLDKMTDAIGRWIDFNTRLQVAHMDAIKTGWETISIGQTPYMSKSLDIMTSYTKQNLELQGESTRTAISLMGKVAGVVVGSILGISGVGTGFSVVGGLGTMQLAESLGATFLSMAETMQKKILNDFNLEMQKFGFLNQMQNMVRLQKVGVAGYLSASGQVMESAGVTDVYRRASELELGYAGVPGFQKDEIIRTLNMLGMTKQFGGVDNLQFTEQLKLMGATTGLGDQAVLGYLTELRLRLGSPLSSLSDTFGKLVDVSNKLEMPLQQVMEDFKQLVLINQKYGFSQDQLMGLYTEFMDEVKKGTVTMQDFGRVIEGMSKTPTEKAIGIGALLQSTDRNLILSNVPEENRAGVSSLLDMVGGMEAQDVGLFLKYASQPNAHQNPFMKQLLSKYGISQTQLSGIGKSPLQALLGLSLGYGSMGGSPGLGQVIFEAFANLVDLNLPSDLYSQSELGRMIQSPMSTGGRFTGERFRGDVSREMDYLRTYGRSPWEAMNLEAFNKEFLPLIEKFNTHFFKTKDVFQSFYKILPEFSEAMTRVNKDMTNRLDFLMKGEYTSKMSELEKQLQETNTTNPWRLFNQIATGLEYLGLLANKEIIINSSPDIIQVNVKTQNQLERH